MLPPHSFISDNLLARLRTKSWGSRLIAELEEHGERLHDGYNIPSEKWQDIRRDYGLAPSRGFGDTFSKGMKKLGIRECGGCQKRRKKLNQLIKYKDKE